VNVQADNGNVSPEDEWMVLALILREQAASREAVYQAWLSVPEWQREAIEPHPPFFAFSAAAGQPLELGWQF
jgi:hypothetical protein